MANRGRNDIGSLLASAVPAITAREAEDLARRYFGIEAVAGDLAGERDRNFHLAAADGRHYVLKVGNPAEDRQVTALQTQALRHIAAVDPALPVPRVSVTRHGEAELALARADGEVWTVRILSYLPGEPLHRAARGSAQRRNLGACLARLDRALRGFFHLAAGHELMWDLKHASRVRAFFVHIPDAGRRALAARFLDAFERHALPLLPALRAQVIHNDMNPHNVLVRPDAPDEIAGIIDFGDMVHAPLVNDLAIACAYQLGEGGHPLAAIGEVVAGYHAVLPLEPDEIDLLFDLVATRMVLTVAISGWRAARHPDNRDYVLRNNARAWAGLGRLAALTRGEARDVLHAACRAEKPRCR